MTASGCRDWLDPDRVADRLRSAGLAVPAVQPSYLRSKPESAVVSLCFADDEVAGGYLRWSADTARADALWHKARTRRPRDLPFGPGLARLDAHTVFFGFPNDAELPRLRWYATARKIRRSLAGLMPGGADPSRASTVRVLRYKPERRVVAEVELVGADHGSRRLVLRYASRPGATRLADRARLLTGNGLAVPRPVAQLERDRVSVDEFVTATPLDGSRPPAEVAHGLARFHRTAPTAAAVGTEARSAATELRRLGHGLHGLHGLGTVPAGQGPTIDRVGRRLAATAPATTDCLRLLHGDLHSGNVLWGTDGPVFVDLDRMALGSAAVDLGSLIAEAIAAESLGAGSFGPPPAGWAWTVADEYRRLEGGCPEDELRWYVAVGLLDQSLLAARSLRPHRSTVLLDQALTMLSPASTRAVGPSARRRHWPHWRTFGPRTGWRTGISPIHDGQGSGPRSDGSRPVSDVRALAPSTGDDWNTASCVRRPVGPSRSSRPLIRS